MDEPKIFSDELFQKYSERKYKEYSVCQLEGCNKPIKKLGKGRRFKYCSEKHFKEAKLKYKRMWEIKNAAKVKRWQHESYIKRRDKKLGRKREILIDNYL